jgi:spore maturation protein SpmB
VAKLQLGGTLEQFQVLWSAVVEFLAHPTVRALTTIIAVASAAAGLWAAIKAQRVLHTHRQEILVTQEQSLNDQWQRLNAAMLSNEDLLQTVSNLVGADDIEHYRRASFLQMIANLLYQAHASRGRGTLSEKVYVAHFNSAAYYFRNRPDLFFPIVAEREYPPAFIEDCKRRFKKLKPLKRIEMSREIREYANLWDESEHQGDGIMLPGVPQKMESPSMHQ